MTLSTSVVAVCCSSDSLQLARARLHLVEQAHVLDRDHRLVGEGGHQLDLLVGERPYRLALQNDDPDRRSFPHERDTEHGPTAATFARFQKANSGSASTS